MNHKHTGKQTSLSIPHTYIAVVISSRSSYSQISQLTMKSHVEHVLVGPRCVLGRLKRECALLWQCGSPNAISPKPSSCSEYESWVNRKKKNKARECSPRSR